MFIPITKVDAAQRLVYGLATAEAEDRAGEICDYASTKPLYEKWSDAIAQSTGGKSLGNLRAMHGPVAAGKVTEIAFNDESKQIEICAKVVDDGEWLKVVEGVYTGFSQGGAYRRTMAASRSALVASQHRRGVLRQLSPTQRLDHRRRRARQAQLVVAGSRRLAARRSGIARVWPWRRPLSRQQGLSQGEHRGGREI